MIGGVKNEVTYPVTYYDKAGGLQNPDFGAFDLYSIDIN